jgi:hypothetical protein
MNLELHMWQRNVCVQCFVRKITQVYECSLLINSIIDRFLLDPHTMGDVWFPNFMHLSKSSHLNQFFFNDYLGHYILQLAISSLVYFHHCGWHSHHKPSLNYIIYTLTLLDWTLHDKSFYPTFKMCNMVPLRPFSPSPNFDTPS